MRSAASCCQPLQEIWLPRGALSGVYPADVSVSVGITDDGNGRQWLMASGQHLPARVGGAVAGVALRGAMDVADAGLGLVGAHQGIVLNWDPISLAGDGIFGNFSEVTGRDQLVQRLWRLGLVHGVVVDTGAHRE